jgi:arylsulfatase
LVYEQNFIGRERYIITSTQLLPPGHVEVSFYFERQSKEKLGGGVGRLSINGHPAGGAVIAHVGPPSAYGGTFNIGADRGTPVSESYTPPAIFNGTVNEVRITRE